MLCMDCMLILYSMYGDTGLSSISESKSFNPFISLSIILNSFLISGGGGGRAGAAVRAGECRARAQRALASEGAARARATGGHDAQAQHAATGQPAALRRTAQRPAS